MKKSKESEKSKSKENSNELVDSREAIRKNNFEAPKKYWRGPPSEHEKKMVYSYSAYGATNEDIAASLGMDDKTLKKFFPEELLSGRATAKNMIAQKLYQTAVGRDAIHDPDSGEVLAEAIKPNLTALIFLAKTRLGWKETQVLENHEVKSSVQIYLPDNGMKAAEEA